jgi:hypothetical protein
LPGYLPTPMENSKKQPESGTSASVYGNDQILNFTGTRKLKEELPTFFNRDRNQLSWEIYAHNIIFHDHIHNNFQIVGKRRYRVFNWLVFHSLRLFFPNPRVTILKMEEMPQSPGNAVSHHLSVRFLFSGSPRFSINEKEYEGNG